MSLGRTVRVIPQNYNYIHSFTEYLDSELIMNWHNSKGQGNKYAKEKGKWCVLVSCDLNQAIILTRAFVKIFACPSCANWDGTTLSMYCGDAGSGAEFCYKHVQEMVGEFNLTCS